MLKLAKEKLDINGKKTTATLLGYECGTVAQLFNLFSIVTSVLAIFGWIFVKVSEKDNRFDGIDDTEGVVFISGNFSDEYEIDAECKLAIFKYFRLFTFKPNNSSIHSED